MEPKTFSAYRVAEFESSTQPWTHVVEDFIRTLKYYGVRSILGRHVQTQKTIDDQSPIIVTVMGLLNAQRVIRYKRFPMILVCWDVWEPDWAGWKELVSGHDIRAIFVSSRRVQDFLRDAFPALRVLYFTEAIDIGMFSGGKVLRDRGDSVVEVGRRLDSWHDQVVDRLRQDGLSHLYSRQEPGELRQDTFSSRHEYVVGLQNTQISVCFPRALTHRGSAGAVDVVTPRYLEAFAARCVVLGKRPAELDELSPDLWMVEANLANPFAQLCDLLANIGEVQQLVNRNRQIVVEHGNWHTQVPVMLKALARQDV